MGKKLSKLLLSTAILATTAASLTALTQVKKGQAMENETRETRNLSALDEKIAQIDNRTIKAFLEYYASQNMTSASSLPMIDDLESNTRIIVIDTDDAGHFFYKAGGGITAQSNNDDEYKEVIEKVYVPIY